MKSIDQLKFLFFFLLLFSFYFVSAQDNRSKDITDARGLMYEGDVLFGNDKYVNALSLYQEAIKLVENSDSAHLEAELLLNIGLVYDYIGDYEQSLIYYQNSYSIMDSLEDKVYLAAILNNIGAIFSFWEKFETALGFYQQSLEVELDLDNISGIAISYQNMGVVYRNWGQPDSAMYYYNKSLELFISENDSNLIATAYDNIGNLYLDLGQVDAAIDLYNKALEIQLLINDKFGMSYSFNNIGLAYMYKADNERSFSSFLRAAEMAEEINFLTQIVFAYEHLAELSSKLGDYENAYKYHKIATENKDSLFNANSDRQMAEMHARYEVDKKNSEIEIQNLQIIQQENQIKKGNLIRLIILIGLILSFVFIAFMLWLYRQKRSAYEVLLLQNIELAQNEELLKDMKLNQTAEISSKELVINETKYHKSSLTSEQKEAIYQKLLELMEYNRVFLNHDLNVEDLAEKLNSNRRYLSQVVNELHGSNFSTFINTYRVKEARRLLLDPEKFHLSLEGIAHAAGFNSRISFNNAFKKITGLTPAFFQKSSMNKLK